MYRNLSWNAGMCMYFISYIYEAFQSSKYCVFADLNHRRCYLHDLAYSSMVMQAYLT